MFGSTSNPFGQTSNSPFGSPSGFGQTSNSSNNNPFAPKPFGSTAPFGASQTGASLFGGTSTGVFGTATQSPSPFGASSSPAFGSTTPAFGASSSTPAFGASSSPFGGSSVFGQKPAFGAFGSSTPTQPSPFGSTAQASQPAFGNSLFGSSTPLGGSSQPAFGATSTPTFGAPQSASAFGAPQSASAFGSTATQPGSLFGSSGGFGTSSAPAFGSSATSAFGAQSASAFSASSAPAFSFGSSPAFGQTASAFGSTPFPTSTTTPSPFGGQSSVFGAQTTTPAFGNNTGFGQTAFSGAQRGGSRVASYAATIEPDSNNSGATAKLVSISAMPIYKDKSHEELRWEDYQLGDKGGPMPTAQAPGMNFSSPASQPGVLSGTSPFGQTTPSPFSNQTSTNIFAPKTSTPTSTFNATGFMPASSSSPSLFNNSSAPTLFSSVSAPFSNTSSSLFPSSSPSFTTPSFSPQVPGSTPSLFSSVTPSQPGVSFGPTTATFGPGATPSFPSNSLFNTPSTGFANNFSSTSSLTVSSNPLNFNQTTPSFAGFTSVSQPAQQTNNSFPMFSNSQPAYSGAPGTGMFANMSATQNPAIVQPVPATNPFGTLPAMPQMSIGRGGTTPSVQYGISSMPASDKVAPVRISSFLTSRHLSQRRIRLPARKYNPKADGAKVPFFSDDDNTDSTPKADALFFPRENPRALVIRPADHWPLKPSSDKPSPVKDSSPINENGKSYGEAHPAVNGFHSEEKTNPGDDANAQEKQKADSVKSNQRTNGVHDEQYKEDSSYKTLSGHRAGEAAIVYEHGAGIETLMPKLRRSDYYTEPRIQELAAKERAEPGFCCRVKDFTVGRHGFGSIKFFGETDVRRLNLESLVQFNNREVIVYMDDTKKPPVGQGLNKPAEVTLLNIKCFDKKTGRHITEGFKIDKYTEMLKRKAKDQGAEFVSYAPANGEWKFRVDHFSGYGLTDEDDDDAFH